MPKLSVKNLFCLTNVLKLVEFSFALAIMILARCGNKDRESRYFLGWADPPLLQLLPSLEQLLQQQLPTPAAAAPSSSGGSSYKWLDANAFGDLVGYGHVYILVVQIVAVLMGDRAPMHNLLFCCCGSVFYLALGSNRISRTWADLADTNEDMKLCLGALAIINGGVYLVDTVFAVIDLKKN